MNHAVLIRYVSARSLGSAALQMQAVALSWFVYERTGSALNLGMIGLFSFAPSILLMIPAGQVADRFDRRRVVQLALASQAVCSAALFASMHAAGLFLPLAYLISAASGAARAFSQPASQSLLPDLVEPKDLSQAIAASSSSNQAATIAGPAIGGLIMAWTGGGVFLVLAALYLTSAAALLGLKVKTRTPRKGGGQPSPWAGLAYVRTNRIILGAISLDLFTVLLGGVTAILPIFARDILHVGPLGLGFLRSGPAIGALLVGLSLIYMPIRRHAGPILLLTVAGYGVATVLFGLSTDFRLSMAAMIALGGFDMVSVVIRGTLVQAKTPGPMRGRVSAVSGVFIGASNQLGGFESGVVASWIGAAPSAVVGGIGALLVVLGAAILFPEIRRADRLDAALPPAKEAEAAVEVAQA